VAVEKGTKAVISASTADEHSITCERISLLQFPKKSFSTATPDYSNNNSQTDCSAKTKRTGCIESPEIRGSIRERHRPQNTSSRKRKA
jgi:hypothetical protein